jgi:RHS repeat-associated protein
LGTLSFGQNSTTIYANRGIDPSGTYSLSQIEAINTANGNMTLTIPVASLPKGRAGFPVNLSLTYNSALLDVMPAAGRSNVSGFLTIFEYLLPSQFGGWHYSFEYAVILDYRPNPSLVGSCSDPSVIYSAKMTLRMPDGSAKLLRLKDQLDFFGDGYYKYGPDGSPNPCTSDPPLTGTLSYYTVDGSYIRVEVPTASPRSWTIHLPDGTKIEAADGKPFRITDRNGNYFSINNVTLANQHQATQLIDQLNRMIQVEYAGVNDIITFPGPNGTQTTTVSHVGSGTSSGPSAFSYKCTIFGDICSGGTLNPGVYSVSLPTAYSGAPAQTYSFSYDGSAYNYGVLRSITLPTTARAEYHYQTDGQQQLDSTQPLGLGVISKALTYTAQYDNSAVSVTEPTSYDYHGDNTQVTGPDGGITTTYFYTQGGPSNWQYNLAYKIVRPDGSTEETQWARNMPHYSPGQRAANTYRKTVIRSLPNPSGTPSRASATAYSYDKNGNLLTEAVYGFTNYGNIPRDSFGGPSGVPGGASLLKTKTQTFVNKTAMAGDGTETVPEYASAYWNPGVGTLQAIESAEMAEGNGAVKIRQEFAYDNGATTANLLGVKSWDSTKGGDSNPLGTNAVSEGYTYDSYGNRLTRMDANGVVMRTSFDGQSLYPTSIASAYGTSVQQTQTLAYDPASGVLLSSTDANNVTTKYDYDNIGRVVTAHEAFGTALERQTNTAYDDVARRVAVFRDKDATGDGKLVTVTHYDPLSRVRLSRQLEDASTQNANDETAGIKRETRYLYVNGSFNKLESNAFRAAQASAAGSESTMGWTLTKMDTGGRLVSVARFAGAGAPAPWGGNTAATGVAGNGYDGEITTATDEGGKVRRTTVDGAGRLVAVVEDPGVLNYNTTYSYDALDDLILVNQSLQTRIFVYDSLKRLVASTNPENYTATNQPALGCAGGVYANCYYYDSNGNLTKKIDNRGVGVAYAYDPLNRVQSKTYFNLPLTVNYQSAGYTYDDPNVAFSKGRLTSVSTLAGTYMLPSDTSTTNYKAYDALGRVVSSSQTTAGNTYTFSNYSYNLADALTSEMYPSGRVVRTCYDGANRVSQVGGASCSSATGSNASNFLYAAHGAPTQYAMGNTVWHQPSYNSRLQMSGFADVNTTTGGQLLNATLNWGAVNNNGNLQSATFAGGGFTFNQTFGYDGVNRLQTAGEGAGGWSRSFSYDPYGNMTPSGNPSPPTLSFNGNNQIVGQAYDQTGNQLSVNGNMVRYDNENRILAETDGVTQGVETYIYDGNGQRVQKYGPSGTPRTVFVYDAMGQMAAEYSTMPNTSPCLTCYLSPDHLGTPRLVTDGNGAVVARHDYLPFGEEVPGSQFGRDGHWGSGSDSVNQKFAGKERDSESALDYFGARYYGSALGRFTSADWSEAPAPVPYVDLRDPQTLNLYTYGRNNPLSHKDEDGHCTVDGEEHGGVWCFLHSFGAVETAKEARDRVAEGKRREAEAEEWRRTWAKAHGGVDPNMLMVMVMAGAMGELDPASQELSSAEKQVFDELRAEGNEVTVIPRGSGPTADFLVNGVETELKTLTSAGTNTLKNAIQDAAKQGQHIIVDARNVSIRASDVLPQIERAQGNVGNLQGRVTVLTKEGSVKY